MTIENNQVTLTGEVMGGFSFSHEICGEAFYITSVKVNRLSENYDTIPIMVSDRLFDVYKDCSGEYVRVSGQFRSCNRYVGHKNRLILSVFAQEMKISDVLCEDYFSNTIYLDGYICRRPVYRKTPLGREISDLLLAVNRSFGKTDYIPCICWGRNARFAGNLDVGAHCMLWGRIQRREYMKKLDEETTQRRVAFEVSVSKIVSQSER